MDPVRDLEFVNGAVGVIFVLTDNFFSVMELTPKKGDMFQAN